MEQEWTISDAKKLFETGLSDNPNIEACKSSQVDMEIPESYDWREANEACVQPVRTADQECPASYVLQTISAVEDRICSAGSGNPLRISTQELIDCDPNVECGRGTVNKVLNWGRRRGFVAESCFAPAGKKGECPEEHLSENDCRASNQVYKIVDFCIA